MTFSIGRRIAMGFAVALAALVVLGAVSLHNVHQIAETAQWVSHTLEVLEKKEAINAEVNRIESMARGYYVTGDATFKTLHTAATLGIARSLQQMRALTADNPVQQERLDRLDKLLNTRQSLAEQLMELRSTGVDEHQASQLITEGARAISATRGLLDELEVDERHLLSERQEAANRASSITSATLLYGSAVAFLLVALIGWLVTRSIVGPLRALTESADRIRSGDLSARVSVTGNDETASLGTSFNEMAGHLQLRELAAQAQDRFKSSVARFSKIFEGERNISRLGTAVLTELATSVNALRSVLYLIGSDEKTLHKQASHAADDAPQSLAHGEGLTGQSLLTKQTLILNRVPDGYFSIRSTLGAATPAALVILPVLFEGRPKAVLEIATLEPFDEVELNILQQLSDSLGVVLHTIEASERTGQLLQESQALSAELRVQQEQLADRNHELQQQTEQLRKSEELLQQQQEELTQANEEMEQANEELQQTNEEMEEKAVLLAEQKSALQDANADIERARAALESQAAKLSETSKYKSQFLANMSHELRTPLNSLLILSKLLSDNNEANLTAKQVQYATTIHSSGTDLLQLINDILDLSKIESGSVDLEIEEVPLSDVQRFIETTFQHIADNKQVGLKISFAPKLPSTIRTDARRLQQILKNLLSNAFKFTDKGAVELQVFPATGGWDAEIQTLDAAKGVLAFAVHDTGIGIAPDRQQLVFEAFQQADAGTARRYGGTGLGLSISRELAALLGGTIALRSAPGGGSTFTLYVPTQLAERVTAVPERINAIAPTTQIVEISSSAATNAMESAEVELYLDDDRKSLRAGDLTLLIIEDDEAFARILTEFAREKGFKVITARTAAAGIQLALQLKPSAVTLDLHLPDGDGWIVLDRLKHDASTRHIPVHIISVDIVQRERGLRFGAISYLQKPVTKQAIDAALVQTVEFVSRPVKHLLLIEDDAIQRDSLVQLIGDGDVKTTAVGSAHEAMAALAAGKFDCIVLDLGLPDMQGTELIREIQKTHAERTPPIIVYTGKDLTRAEETELKRMTDAIIIKDVKSPERLLDETALFLHRVQSRLPETQRNLIDKVKKSDPVLAGRKALVVDDDVRNIFAITAALENSGMDVLHAENGQDGLKLLSTTTGIDVVLMDVMMPEMDGIEATRRIRKMDKYRTLPIIAVTAKAMKGDREQCLDAGASDYITKPVDMDQLRSLLRVWLYR